MIYWKSATPGTWAYVNFPSGNLSNVTLQDIYNSGGLVYANDTTCATSGNNRGFQFYSGVTIAPVTGSDVGGTPVTITDLGNMFDGSGSFWVTIDGNSGTAFTIIDNQSGTFLTPAGTAGLADVVITTTDNNIITLSGAWTYIGSAVPIVTSPVRAIRSPTSAQKFITPTDLVGQSLPPEILEQLKIVGRVQFKPVPTTVSAVSTAGDQDTDDQKIVQDNLSGTLNHVAEMEGLASQIEDMIDELTKDMAIPVGNNASVSAAVKSLDPNSDGSTITRDVFDKAMALVDHAPILTLGYDPFMAALTGNGSLDGKYLDCDQISRGIAKTWNAARSAQYNSDTPIIDETAKIADEFEKNIGKMVLESLLGLFFNMLWPKFLVDLVIVKPLRMMIANPLDGLICFFKKFPCGNRFTVKTPECLADYGPINKALTKFRCFLLCIPPNKLWDPKKYKPMTDMSKCNCSDFGTPCPKKTGSGEVGVNQDSKLGGMGNVVDGAFPDGEPCIETSDFMDGLDKMTPDGVGIPPECLKHAKIILEAVMADAYSPSSPSQASITGTMSLSSTIKNQTRT